MYRYIVNVILLYELNFSVVYGGGTKGPPGFWGPKSLLEIEAFENLRLVGLSPK